MESDSNPSSMAISRRSMVKTGAALSAGLWVAPSVLTYDRAAAAIGSCGTKPVQIDMSTWAGGQVPANFAANDGTNVTMQILDPDNVAVAGYMMDVSTGTLNGLDNPAIMGMQWARWGAGVTTIFTFDTPIMPSLVIGDIDAASGRWGWRDTVEVTGRMAGGTVNPDSISPGTTYTILNATTVQGTSSTTGTGGNAEFDFQSPIEEIHIRHYDTTGRRGFQWIMVHDLHWC